MADHREPGVLGEIEERERRKRVIGLAVAILAIILAVLLARTLLDANHADRDIVDDSGAVAAGPDPDGPAPGAAPVAYVPGSLAAYMAGDQPLPYRYELGKVTFDSGSARIEDGATDEIADIATALHARSSARVSLRGYADPEGAADANQRLSAERAEAVKAALVRAGANAGQVDVASLGETGDAAARQNRRVELELTAR